jgi:light-regulated signal transduction histidine kinase (bacteriophytochrome)
MNHGQGEIYGIASPPARFAVRGLGPSACVPSPYGWLYRAASRKASSVVDEKSNHHMAMVLESAKRMGNLIDDLLAFSRIGRAETQKTLVSLEQLVREALTEVRQDTEGRNIVWKIGALPPAAVKKGIHHVPAHSHLLRM